MRTLVKMTVFAGMLSPIANVSVANRTCDHGSGVDDRVRQHATNGQDYYVEKRVAEASRAHTYTHTHERERALTCAHMHANARSLSP